MSNVIIYDVVGVVGVLLVIVFRVLNLLEKVKEEMCLCVLKVIKELGYRFNVIVRGLVSRKIIIVGVVILDIIRVFVFEMLGGIVDIVEKYKYFIKFFIMYDEVDVLDIL